MKNIEETQLHAAQYMAEKNPQDTREVDPLTDNDEPTFEEKLKDAYQCLIRFCHMFSSLLKTFITRIIFTLHFLLAYWVVTVQVKWKFGFWFLPLGLFCTTTGKHYHFLHTKRSRVQMVLYKFKILLIQLHWNHSPQFVTIIAVSSHSTLQEYQ